MATENYLVFDLPHRALRNAWGKFTLLAGQTDYSVAEEVEHLYQTGFELFGLLSGHAEDEDHILHHALAANSPEIAQRDLDSHARLHALQTELETRLELLLQNALSGQVAPQLGAEFYQKLNIYHGYYLLHMAEEENETQDRLRTCLTIEELEADRARIMQKMPPEKLLTWLKFAIPTFCFSERVAMVNGLCAGFPPEMFERLMLILQSAMPETEFQALQGSLETV
jgi:hypothetical protein